MTPTETPDITQGGGESTTARSLAGSEGSASDSERRKAVRTLSILCPVF